MALIVRDPQTRLPAPLGHGLFDWTLQPLESWRRLLEEDQVKVEEFTENGMLVVRAEIPGVDPEQDVNISMVDGNLVIRAERRQEKEVDDRDYRRAEIRYGSFSRALPLPPNTKEEDIQATYRDGMLEVRAPLARRAAAVARRGRSARPRPPACTPCPRAPARPGLPGSRGTPRRRPRGPQAHRRGQSRGA
jgi:HSP20 family protein